MSTNSVINVADLTKVYVTDEVETHALTGVNLRVDTGEHVAIMGPSGCGKTTLMSILGLLDAPTGGTYDLAGTPVAKLDARQRAHFRNRNIGFVFQSFNLIGDLSVYENVELPLVYRGGLGRTDRRRKVAAALESVNMSHRMRHYPAQLSGGQQQRVAIARALVGDPAILLADEPTGNLDSANGEKVMDLLADLNTRGTTLLMVTHDPRYAAHAKRLVRLFDGQIVTEQESVRSDKAARR
ncbi:MAG: ATP-binding cassette domain-containing protein [Gallionella sp.]|jgi:putative ABC transport system ATP-binding protein|nr:ATP-binding cassette domain-containing protein [Gallionella sp.]